MGYLFLKIDHFGTLFGLFIRNERKLDQSWALNGLFFIIIGPFMVPKWVIFFRHYKNSPLFGLRVGYF